MALLLKQGGYLLRKAGGKILLQGDPGAVAHVLAPSWRTVDMGNGQGGALAFAAPLDPSEIKEYTLNWATEANGANDRIATSALVLSSQAIVAGLMVHSTTNDNTSVTVWLKVDPALQGSAAWAEGETHVLTSKVTTLGGRVFERTASVTVRQL